MRLLLRFLMLTLVAPLPLLAQGTSTDTLPASVVQRFVDAANARDAKAMAALVSPTATFGAFPSGNVFVSGRDSIQAYYDRLIGTLPQAFRITVQPRIVEEQIVIDEEHFTGLSTGQSKNTWMYLVRHGLIEKAWVVQGRAPRAQ